VKYGRREWERRFLVPSLPAGPFDRIVRLSDRYIEGTRLRLRRADDGSNIVYKLTQKHDGFLNTIYLSVVEHAVFAELPARIIEKTRHHLGPWGIDVFASGLILAEIETDSEESLETIAIPAWAGEEVTRDARYSGGALAGRS
jgi:CYTH domain-containing protein